MQTIHLEPNQVPAALRGSYTGKKFKAVIVTEVTIPMDAGLWSGGSRDEYHMVRLEDGKTVPFPGQELSPWCKGREERKVTLVPGMAVVRDTVFCGKPMGLTFYIHPTNATAMLPAPVAVTDVEKVVLTAIRSYKSGYRRQMAQGQGVNGTAYDAAIESLRAKGMVAANGGITTKGKNAVGDSY